MITRVLIVDDNSTNLNFLSVSPSMERLLGYKPQDFIGQPVTDLVNLLTPESFEQAVADVVEAMASNRPYRPGLGIDAALNEIEKNRRIFYDSAVADACLRLFREKGFQIGK